MLATYVTINKVTKIGMEFCYALVGASSKSTGESLLLGLRKWQVFNDFACFGEFGDTQLSFTGCTDLEFNCDSAQGGTIKCLSYDCNVKLC